MTKGFRSYGVEIVYTADMLKGIKNWVPAPRLLFGKPHVDSAVDAKDGDKIYAAWYTGKEASEAVKHITLFPHVALARVMPLPETARLVDHVALGLDNDTSPGEYFAAQSVWQDRERARFASGQYIATPWETEPPAEYRLHCERIVTRANALGHFLHVCENDNQKIAYTETTEKGIRDIQTVMRPGKYLTKYAHLFGISNENIAALTAHYGLKYGGEQPVKFAHTEEEIVSVYTNGPRSCMAGDEDNYSNRYHPCRVYAAGDLAIAYLERCEDDGEYDEDDEDEDEGEGYVGDHSITARAIVWPEKKIYGRIYGDGIRLGFKLRALGYHPAETSAEWNGAKLQKVPQKGYPDYFHGPYLDVADGRVKYRRTHFEINASDYDGRMRETHGVFHCDTGEKECQRCEAIFEEDTGSYIDGEFYCQSCYDDISWTCPCCDQIFHCENVNIVNVAGAAQIQVCADCVDDGSFRICAHDGLIYALDDMVEFCDANGNHAWIARRNMDAHGVFECSVRLTHYTMDCLAGHYHGEPVSDDGFLDLEMSSLEEWRSLGQSQLDDVNRRLQLPLPLSHPNEVVCTVAGPMTPLEETSGKLIPCVPGLNPDWTPIAAVNEMSNINLIWSYDEPRY